MFTPLEPKKKKWFSYWNILISRVTYTLSYDLLNVFSRSLHFKRVYLEFVCCIPIHIPVKIHTRVYTNTYSTRQIIQPLEHVRMFIIMANSSVFNIFRLMFCNINEEKMIFVRAYYYVGRHFFFFVSYFELNKYSFFNWKFSLKIFGKIKLHDFVEYERTSC